VKDTWYEARHEASEYLCLGFETKCKTKYTNRNNVKTIERRKKRDRKRNLERQKKKKRRRMFKK
jgi:hypothetical protein